MTAPAPAAAKQASDPISGRTWTLPREVGGSAVGGPATRSAPVDPCETVGSCVVAVGSVPPLLDAASPAAADVGSELGTELVAATVGRVVTAAGGWTGLGRVWITTLLGVAFGVGRGAGFGDAGFGVGLGVGRVDGDGARVGVGDFVGVGEGFGDGLLVGDGLGAPVTRTRLIAELFAGFTSATPIGSARATPPTSRAPAVAVGAMRTDRTAVRRPPTPSAPALRTTDVPERSQPAGSEARLVPNGGVYVTRIPPAVTIGPLLPHCRAIGTVAPGAPVTVPLAVT
jgi:hypothetical protein